MERAMFDDLFPRTIDNTYRGHRIALVLFGILLFLKTAMSLGSIFNGRAALTGADGVPLDTYPAAAAQTIVALFAIYALLGLLFCVLGVLALVRYRRIVPSMLALFLVEHLTRKLILRFIPIVRVGSPPAFAINLVLLGVIVAGLALSLWRRSDLQLPLSTEVSR
jgi:hypothetical protein